MQHEITILPHKKFVKNQFYEGKLHNSSSKSELQTITETNSFLFAMDQSIPREGQSIPFFRFQKGKLKCLKKRK